MRYEEPLHIGFSEAEAGMASGNPTVIADTLLRASLSEIDPAWVEIACLWALEQSETEVKWAALAALEHLVRRYRHVDVDAVLAKITPLCDDSDLLGKVNDLLDDMDMYIA